MRRLIPGENVNAVAAEQIRSWLRQTPHTASHASVPIFSFDAGYDSLQLRLAQLTNLSACWFACGLVAASTLTRRHSPRLGARGVTGRSSSALMP